MRKFHTNYNPDAYQVVDLQGSDMVCSSTSGRRNVSAAKKLPSPTRVPDPDLGRNLPKRRPARSTNFLLKGSGYLARVSLLFAIIHHNTRVSFLVNIFAVYTLKLFLLH